MEGSLIDLNVQCAKFDDIGRVIHLSTRDIIEQAVSESYCYILENFSQLIGCVFVRPLKLDSFPKPHWYLHSFMLEPTKQRKGLGVHALTHVIEQIKPTQGTIFLDCWAGNNKLRDFYTRAGFTLRRILQEHDYEVAVFFLFLKDWQGALPTCCRSDEDKLT
ncbi:hypothetical protein GQ44DRAFT_719371 [Phaeosphaeriaceae sp. PMI808]|nr:hypothetical protein GQ44DRAFT_719371 [Phaeosphaeriaceae sp. PMI808]